MPNPNQSLLIIEQKTYWPTQGTEPADELKIWVPRQKPPSAWWNWFSWATYKDIEALALFMQDHVMARDFQPGDFEFPDTDGAQLVTAGDNELPVAVFAADKAERIYLASRVVRPAGNTLVAIVWSTENAQAGKQAYLKLERKVTAVGDSRNGAVTALTSVEIDSDEDMGVNVTVFDLGELDQGDFIDLWLTVDGTHNSHTLTVPVYVHQIIQDFDPASGGN